MSLTIRRANFAGSWYTDDPDDLDRSLTQWLSNVDGSKLPPPDKVPDASAQSSESLALPIKGCKAIIGPHAGYSYSGPAAAWAYKCIDTTGIKRVFILGPCHYQNLDGCGLTKFDEFETPLGNLIVDKQTIAELHKTAKFVATDHPRDLEEHSLEMHLPYIYKTFEGCGIKIVPIMVGAISTSKENLYGKILAPYLADPKNIFVISSDFCHWGSRFSYTYYKPSAESGSISLTPRSELGVYSSFPVYKSIQALDNEGMLAITHPFNASSSQTKTAVEARDSFADYIKRTKNTVCGRHPIGVLLGALAELEQSKGIQTECRFVRYEQSSTCHTPRDSSVSYASAYVKFRE